MRRARVVSASLLVVLVVAAASSADAACPRLRIASKPFTESYVLSEILTQLVEGTGETSAERVELGGPNMVIDALRTGAADLDVNYTGSLANLLLKDVKSPDPATLERALAAQGIVIGAPLGFNNTYAIAVRTETATKLGLSKVSDLRGHRGLRGAFTPDFLNFDDGFYKLQALYGIELDSIRPMQHALAYRALASGEIDVTDAYTTDGSLSEFELTLLADDREFFPKYYGVVTARANIPGDCPRTWAALRRLEGRFTDAKMIALNAKVERKTASVAETARVFLAEEGLLAAPARASVVDAGLLVATREHLVLVLVSLLLSCLVGVPLGVLAYRRPRLGHAIIGVAGLLQTIPSLALLCFLIPFLGIGALPTITALFVYGLLPIVQSTASGLFALPPDLVETARILGLTRSQALRLVELPIASINILAGIKTSAVINVATATIAALIGAGGYGRYITSGLAMNDNTVILQGAIPTALMAIGFHFAFELLGRAVVPEGLRTTT
ncbi:ABC transporter permease subunit [Myxococcota bacterium]|nr:ABC transporter permease subunit [Myxococcota bacterium]